MNTSPTQPPQAVGVPLPVSQGMLHWAEEHDVALGCECANPVLQIERWCMEAQPDKGN